MPNNQIAEKNFIEAYDEVTLEVERIDGLVATLQASFPVDETSRNQQILFEVASSHIESLVLKNKILYSEMSKALNNQQESAQEPET